MKKISMMNNNHKKKKKKKSSVAKGVRPSDLENGLWSGKWTSDDGLTVQLKNRGQLAHLQSHFRADSSFQTVGFFKKSVKRK